MLNDKATDLTVVLQAPSFKLLSKSDQKEPKQTSCFCIWHINKFNPTVFTEFSKRLINAAADTDGCHLDAARLAKEESLKAPDVK